MAIALKFYFLFVPIIGKYIAFDALAAVISAFAMFLISAVIIAVVNNIFYLAFNGFCGGFLDRSVGVLFGFIRGCSLVSFGFYILLMFMPHANLTINGQTDYAKFNTAPQWAKSSKSIILLNRGADIIGEFVPKDFERKLKHVLVKEHGGVPANAENKTEVGMSSPVQDRITQVLHSTPADVLNSMSGDKLIMLQDADVPLHQRAKILEDIKQAYKEYINDREENLTSEEINKMNLKYYETMGVIDSVVKESNTE